MAKYEKMPPWADRFFDLYARYGSQEAARRGVDLKSASSISNWKKNNKEFAKRFDEARIAHQELLEYELSKRAVWGIEEPVIYRGQPQFQRNPATGQLIKDEDGAFVPVRVRKYSDQLLVLKLKSEMPDKYGGQEQIALAAIRDAKSDEDHSAPSKQELRERLKKLRESKKQELELIQGGKAG
jgi:hypothetical protein